MAIWRKQLVVVAAVEGRPEGQQLVEGQAQGVDVGALVDHPAAGQGLLGAHVAERADQVAGPRQAEHRRGTGPGRSR